MSKSTSTSTYPQQSANTIEENIPPTNFPGSFESFIETLPEWRKTTASFDLRQLWHTAKENADRARTLESRAEELSSLWQQLCAELQSRGLTIADLLAYERQQQSQPPFEGQPEYVLPPSYRNSGTEN